MLTVRTPSTTLICGVSTATPRFRATLLTATSDIRLKSASLPESSFPDPIAFAKNSAAEDSFPEPFKCDGKSLPIEDNTFAADS